MSLEARESILWNQSIELNTLNNFCSICLNKMFTSKKLSISTEIRISSRALRPVGLLKKSIDRVQYIEQLLCLNKMFINKKLTISTEIRLYRRALMPMGLFLKINPWSSIILTTFVLYVSTKYLPVKRYSTRISLRVMSRSSVLFSSLWQWTDR